jgi:hypothetical protein
MEKEQITMAECYTLLNSISQLASSVPSLKGKIVYALSKNEQKLESVLKKADKKQKEIIDKYVKKDKDGNYELSEVSEEELMKGKQKEYIYKNEADKEKAIDEMNKYMSKKIEIEFHKIWKNDFDNIDAPIARNPGIGVIVDLLVSDVVDLNMTV